MLLILQLWFLVFIFQSNSYIAGVLQTGAHVMSGFLVLYIVSKKDKGANKVAWVFLILLFPLMGGLLYLLYHFQASTRKMEQKIARIEKKNRRLYELPGNAAETASIVTPEHMPQIRYLEFAGFPVYDGTQTEYFSPGESFFPVLLEELKKSTQYIFIEYFIIKEGVMWNSVLDILKEKVCQGVEVRVIYDDIGCFLTLPENYVAQLEKAGIKCAVFNPFRPILSAVPNNRDHRKITVIDGKVAFTGGINLSDEYINTYEKYGYWKDAAIEVRGKAAWSLTVMFLEMWELCRGEQEEVEHFFPKGEVAEKTVSDGFVQPYSDSPMDDENVGEHVYLQILNNAKDYVYICTPYLIVDDSMVSALCLAAKSGVDVRIITPHIWDKALIHLTTRSYYRELIHGGVKIYEYSKGFMHSKIFVSDDRTATVGTTNLDFRSLYLHFECGVWMYDSRAVMQIKKDYLDTLTQCHQITWEECKEKLPDTDKWNQKKDLWRGNLESLYSESRNMLHNHRCCLKLILLDTLKLSCLYTIPFLCIRMIGDTGVDFEETLALSAIMILLVGVLPSVAGIGPTEAAFMLLFSACIGHVSASAALILYRIATYFFPFTISIGVFFKIQKKITAKKNGGTI